MADKDKDLIVIEQKPADVVIYGKESAQELTKIVSSRERKLVMQGKQYLFFEDWQTIGKFYGVTAKVTNTQEIKEGDKLIGFVASAVAVAGDKEISGADAECTYDEQNWQSKPRFQLRSMAQTRACSKALRNCLAWVAVLAGYEPTPAEEMEGIAHKEGEEEPKVTPAQLKKIYATAKEQNYESSLATSIMIRLYGTGHSKELTKKQASDFIQKLSEGYGLTENSTTKEEVEDIPY